MADTPKRSTRHSPLKPKVSPCTSEALPRTPQILAPGRQPDAETPGSARRSSRLSGFGSGTAPRKFVDYVDGSVKGLKSVRKCLKMRQTEVNPVTPDKVESKKCKRERESGKVVDGKRRRVGGLGKGRRVYYKKVMYDGCQFKVGDDVYVKRREDASSDEEDVEVEECRVCFKIGKAVMIECDDCLGGFHLKCVKPLLKEVPEEDWICQFCEARKLGKQVLMPSPSDGRKRRRTAREKLLSGDLWAAHIERYHFKCLGLFCCIVMSLIIWVIHSIWKEVDYTYWFRARWYLIPEETEAGRQQHNLRRELYSTNHLADVEVFKIVLCFWPFMPRHL